MKKEDVLEFIEKEMKITDEERQEYSDRVDYQKNLRLFRNEISECKAIALDIYNAVKGKLDNLNQIMIATAINKLTMSFSHLGTAIKNNRDFNPNLIIIEFLNLKSGNIAASIAKDMIGEIIEVLVENPDLVQVSNYERILRKKLVKSGWEIGEEYEAKDKKLSEEFFEGAIPQPLRQLFSEYIDYKRQFGYPYAMVINSASDIKPIVDSKEMNNAIEKERYTMHDGTFAQSYEVLNIFQRIDWLRKKLFDLIEKIDSFGENADRYEIHVVFSSMELHDVRVLFGHLLPILK